MASVASLWPKLSQRQAACFQAVIKNDRLAAEECRDAELARNTFVQQFFFFRHHSFKRAENRSTTRGLGL